MADERRDLYNLYRHALDDQTKRFARIFDSTTKFLAALSFLSGALAFIEKWLVHGDCCGMRSSVPAGSAAIGWFMFVCLVVGWFSLCGILLTGEAGVVEIGGMAVESEMPKVYDQLIPAIANAISLNSTKLRRKSFAMSLLVGSVLLASICMALLSMLYVHSDMVAVEQASEHRKSILAPPQTSSSLLLGI